MDNTELMLVFFAGIGFIVSVIGTLSSYKHFVLKKKAELKLIENLRNNVDVAKNIQALALQAPSDKNELECAIVNTLKPVLSTLPDREKIQIRGLHQPSMKGRFSYAKKLLNQSGIGFPNPPINLVPWRNSQFREAEKANWLRLYDIFGPAIPAFRTHAIKRAKKIDLGQGQMVVLSIDLQPTTDQEMSVILRLSPINTLTHLPDNLKFTVIPKSGKPDEYLAKSHHPAFETEWFFKPGEQFSVKVQLNNVTVRENFII